MSNRIKIFSDKNWMPKGKNHTIMLYPFWGEIPLPEGDPDIGRFDDYVKNGNKIFEMTVSLDDCDFAVLPFEYVFDKEGETLAQLASAEVQKKNKKLIVFYNNDNPSPININNSIVFRTSFLNSTKKPNEYALPGWSVDFIKRYSAGKFSTIKKSEQPVISYCGYVDSLEEKQVSLTQKVKSIFGTEDFYGKGSVLRGKAVRNLMKEKQIKTEFIIRNGFWAEGMADKNAARKQYAENMMNSPYAFVARGAGNFSYRLYEVMSCGRIPVFINTDCVLPYPTFINWKKNCVWIEENNVKNISSELMNFHKTISENELDQMQSANRKIYEEWLCPEGFFKNIHKAIN